jgi:hypothetical protein
VSPFTFGLTNQLSPSTVIPIRPLGYELLEVGVFGEDSAPAAIIARTAAFRLHVLVVVLQNEKPIPANKQMLVDKVEAARSLIESMDSRAKARSFSPRHWLANRPHEGLRPSWRADNVERPAIISFRLA